MRSCLGGDSGKRSRVSCPTSCHLVTLGQVFGKLFFSIFTLQAWHRFSMYFRRSTPHPMWNWWSQQRVVVVSILISTNGEDQWSTLGRVKGHCYPWEGACRIQSIGAVTTLIVPHQALDQQCQASVNLGYVILIWEKTSCKTYSHWYGNILYITITWHNINVMQYFLQSKVVIVLHYII